MVKLKLYLSGLSFMQPLFFSPTTASEDSKILWKKHTWAKSDKQLETVVSRVIEQSTDTPQQDIKTLRAKQGRMSAKSKQTNDGLWPSILLYHILRWKPKSVKVGRPSSWTETKNWGQMKENFTRPKDECIDWISIGCTKQKPSLQSLGKLLHSIWSVLTEYLLSHRFPIKKQICSFKLQVPPHSG